MTNNENIYEEWRRTLDGLGLQADDRSQQKARVVAARAQVDQAISLATIADSLDQLVAHFAGRPADAPVEAVPEPTLQGIQSEHDVEVGDMVSPLVKGDGPVRAEVVEVGTDQGEAWIKLNGEQPKFWAKLFVVVERAADEAAFREGPQVVKWTKPIATTTELSPELDVPRAAQLDAPDDIDDDFASNATDADEQQADALAALRARQGKSKKGGQKR